MSQDPIERFEAEWRRVAERPPTLSAQEAAAAVVERLGAGPVPWRRRSLLPLASAAAVLFLAVGAPLLLPPLPVEPTQSSKAGHETPLGSDVLLLWLDTDTPLYLTLPSTSATQGERL